MNRIVATVATLALAAGTLASSMLVAGDAEARRGGRSIYTQQYDFDRPMHGYEGHTGTGYYCSYKRLPKRVCSYGSGGEVGKIQVWTLEQTCY